MNIYIFLSSTRARTPLIVEHYVANRCCHTHMISVNYNEPVQWSGGDANTKHTLTKSFQAL